MEASRQEARQPQEVQEQLPYLCADFARKTGKPFQHFYCPILQIDEPAELCMGHVINAKIKGSHRGTVVQRKDVDNFYGQVFENDLCTFFESQNCDFMEMAVSSSIHRKIPPRFFSGGKQYDYYVHRGESAESHTPVLLDGGEAGNLGIVLKMPREELATFPDGKMQIGFEKDFRISVIASLIKAAYLTLFRMLGYSYPLSAAGIESGYNILGRFYKDNRASEVRQAREAGRDFFKQYGTMVRPIEAVIGDAPLGTIEDQRVCIAYGACRNRPYGLLVWVRLGSKLHGVLMPMFQEAEGAANYWSFLNSDKEVIHMNPCFFDIKEQTWILDEPSVEVRWPKVDESFEFD